MILGPRLRHAGINYFFFFLAFFLAVFFFAVFFLVFFFERHPQVLHIFVSPTRDFRNQYPPTRRIHISVILIGRREIKKVKNNKKKIKP